MMDGYLPIIEVTDDNFLAVLPALQKAIEGASFLAVDCELTGIGERKKVNSPEIDLRYQYTAEVARSHAVIALGLSCFTCKSVSSITVQEGQQIRSHDYLVQTFNILTLYSGSFTVECSAHKFLLEHGFDFNKLYAKGLLYYKGCDQQRNEAPNVRHLFSAMVKHKKPVVIHNGLMDLIFLYQSFYADLPNKVETFAADLTDMFPCGIYDTKYIAEFHQMLPATYLEYLYKKMQLKNAQLGREGEWHVRVKFPPYPLSLANVEWHPYLQILSYSTEADNDKREMCNVYAFHGWCSKGKACEKSHNVNRIVKTLQPVGAKKRGNSKHSLSKQGSLTSIIQNQVSKRMEREGGTEWKKNGNAQEGKKRRRKREAKVFIEAELEDKKMRVTADDMATKEDKKQNKVKMYYMNDEEEENEKEIRVTVESVTKENSEKQKKIPVKDVIEEMDVIEKDVKVTVSGVSEREEENEKMRVDGANQESETQKSVEMSGDEVNEEENQEEMRETTSIICEEETENENMQVTINNEYEKEKENEKIQVTMNNTSEEEENQKEMRGTKNYVIEEKRENETDRKDQDNSYACNGHKAGLDATLSSVGAEMDKRARLTMNLVSENRKCQTDPSLTEENSDISPSAVETISGNPLSPLDTKSDISINMKKFNSYPFATKNKLDNSPSPTEKKLDNSHCCNGHRAGFDAFMTGFIFACHVSNSGTLASGRNPFTPEDIGMSEFVNKVYLMGKNFPFLVRTGTYANMSANHTSKIPKLRKITTVV